MKEWNWSTWKPPVEALAALGEIAKDSFVTATSVTSFEKAPVPLF